MFSTIAVFGLGLLGGSLCQALRRRMPGITITAFDRDAERIQGALSGGVVDFVSDISGMSVKGADLCVVATPVGASLDIITSILDSPELGTDSLVIDVGSVKRAVVAAARASKRPEAFIGCHPMAGSEKSGYEHADADLYCGSSVIITPHAANRPGDIAKIRSFWEGIGASVVEATPEAHDAIVAATSHIPHIAACAVVEQLMKSATHTGDTGVLAPFTGRGFRDVTRIAAGSPEMWNDIVRLNADNISEGIGRMIAALEELRSLIGRGNEAGTEIARHFEAIKKFRNGI